jgi:prevent-host-death family protein
VRSIDIAKATGQLREYAENVCKDAVIVTRHGKPIAAVVGVEDFDYESLSLSTNPQFIELIARSRARLEREGGISTAEVRRRLGLKKSNGKRKTVKR